MQQFDDYLVACVQLYIYLSRPIDNGMRDHMLYIARIIDD